LTALVELVASLRRDLEAQPADPALLSEWGRRSLEKIDVQRGISEDHEDPVQASQRFENVQEMVQALGQMNLADFAKDEAPPQNGLELLREYLTLLLLQAQDEEDKKKDDPDAPPRDEVTLLTLHGAKGLEYPLVFLVGLEDGLIPHR